MLRCCVLLDNSCIRIALTVIIAVLISEQDIALVDCRLRLFLSLTYERLQPRLTILLCVVTPTIYFMPLIRVLSRRPAFETAMALIHRCVQVCSHLKL